MSGISINRMTVELPGVHESEGRSLAMGITEGLAAAGLINALGEVPTMRINLTASAGAATDRLANQVVSEILQQLRRLP